jgi:hypothetical protein
MRKMRNKAAATEADTVLKPTLRFLVNSYESMSVSMPVFAAVSPKRDRGP